VINGATSQLSVAVGDAVEVAEEAVQDLGTVVRLEALELDARHRLARALGIGVASCVAQPAATPKMEPLSNFPQVTLSILTPDARQHRLQVWVADTDAHRQQGLMFVKSLPDSTGMLFVFDQPRQIQMWMKNTLIPLDMLFIDANGRVDSIAVNTTPMSLSIIESKNPVLGVMELRGLGPTRLRELLAINLLGMNAPGIVLECATLTSPRDRARLERPKGLSELAAGIADGIVAYQRND
jgi:hypothetical protein